MVYAWVIEKNYKNIYRILFYFILGFDFFSSEISSPPPIDSRIVASAFVSSNSGRIIGWQEGSLGILNHAPPESDWEATWSRFHQKRTTRKQSRNVSSLASFEQPPSTSIQLTKISLQLIALCDLSCLYIVLNPYIA